MHKLTVQPNKGCPVNLQFLLVPWNPDQVSKYPWFPQGLKATARADAIHGTRIAKLTAMIRITTHYELSRTVVTIDGQLTTADFPEVRRARESVSGGVALDLAGLDTCARDGIRLLQDWLDAGARLDTATPFLRMMLQDQKARDSRKKNSSVTFGPDSSIEPP